MNKVILMGRLTKDVELKVTPNGINVCDFSVAVDRRFQKAGSERQADFINCRAWRNTAEFVSRWFSKGRMISVVGTLQTRTWDDNEGKKHYATEVIVDEAYFCGDKGNTNQSGGFGGASVPSPAANTSQSPFPDDMNDFIPIDSEDDLPF